MNNLELAAQLYTLRDFTKTPKDLKQTIIKVKDMGYDSFQLSGAGPIDPNQVKEFMDEVGIYMSATHTSPDRLKNDLDNVIKEHKLWNCEFVGIGMMPESYRKDSKSIVQFAKEYSDIGRKLKAEGLTLIYHNHNFEFQKYNGKLIMDILMEESDPLAFDFEIDTYWVQAGGANPVDWIYKVDGRMRYIHFKDMGINNSEQVFEPVGEGNLQWDKIIEACKNTSVECCAVEQDACYGKSPFDCLKTSHDNIRNSYNF